MPKSLAHGDYSLILAIESASRPDSWYRVLADRHTGALSCDCPVWTFNHNQRTCQHTEFAQQLTTGQTSTSGGRVRVSTHSALIEATHIQWPGLGGSWSQEQAEARIKTHPYTVILLRLAIGNGGMATGAVAFAERHHHPEQRLQSRVAGWAGYAIAAEVARLGGFPLMGQFPEHFKVDRSTSRRQRPTTPEGTASIPPVSLRDILRVGDEVQLHDGLTPESRAEQTLRLFIGQEMYGQLERHGFIDISSVRYAAARRVYRIRRDPSHRQDRRIRVFEHGRYINDFCIVRGMVCPEADMVLTSILGLLSDETALLSVVGSHNIFGPNSDGAEQETVPAVWRPRADLN